MTGSQSGWCLDTENIFQTQCSISEFLYLSLPKGHLFVCALLGSDQLCGWCPIFIQIKNLKTSVLICKFVLVQHKNKKKHYWYSLLIAMTLPINPCFAIEPRTLLTVATLLPTKLNLGISPNPLNYFQTKQ
jgi:hypothetical protein